MSTSISYEPTSDVPDAVLRVTDAMSTFPGTWALCGGWAVDAWAGRSSRQHGDVDIAVFIDDQRALYDHLVDGWQLIGHDPNVADNTSEAWNGRKLDLPAHIHGRRDTGEPLPDDMDDPGGGRFNLDVLFSERAGGEWVLSQQPRVDLPLQDAVRRSPWGLPTAVPEVLLFFKADDPRLRDKIDFLALRPILTKEQRDWLRDALTRLGHPWLSRLPA